MDVYDTEVAGHGSVVDTPPRADTWDDIPENLRPDHKGPIWPFVLAGFMFVLTWCLWLILMGWVIHLWSIIDAALYEPPRRRSWREERYGRYA